MLMSPVDEPLVNLIAEAESVVFNTEVCNHLKLTSGVNLQNEDRNDCKWFHFFPHMYEQAHTKNWKEYEIYLNMLTFPTGLLGVLMMMAFVLELNLLASSPGSRAQSALVTELCPDV